MMGERERTELANSFGAAATEYERARPTYPEEAVQWLLPAGARTVLDLGAGTGKLTRALPEAARVLRPGGTLGLIWNVRDEGTDWVRRLSGVIHKSGGELAVEGDVVIGPPFGPTARLDVRWSRTMTLELLLEMVRSRSYVITAPAEEREAILAGVRALVESEPGLAAREGFELPYLTSAFRARFGT